MKETAFTLASGPYGLLFASFVPFNFDIPVSARFCIFSLQSTDKSFIYLAGFQLLFSSWKRSIVPGICGVTAGLFYRLNTCGTHAIKFPDVTTSFFSRFFSWPFFGNSLSILSSGSTSGSAPTSSSHQAEVNNSSSAFGSAAEPTESSINTLVSMGFDRLSARQALMLSSNDLSLATNILLEAQSR